MSGLVVVNKISQEKESFNGEKIVLSEASIVHLKIQKEDVIEFVKNGNTLVLKLKNGEIITIDNFFTKFSDDLVSDLVFDDDACAFLWFDFNNGQVSFKEISGLEVLLPESTAISLTPWLIGGAALVGGVAAAAGGGSSSTSSKSNNNESKPQNNELVEVIPPKVKVDIVVDTNDTTHGQFIFNFDQDIKPESFTLDDLEISGAKVLANSFEQIDEKTWVAKFSTTPGTEITALVKFASYESLTGVAGLLGSNTFTSIKINSVKPILEGNETVGTEIEGKTSPNTDVIVTLPNGTQLGPIQSDENGNWHVTTPEKLTDGEEVVAEILQDDPNAPVISDKVILPLVSIDLIAKDDVINKAEIDESGNSTVKITGTVSNPNAHLVVTVNNQNYDEANGLTVNKDGTWEVNVPSEILNQGNNHVSAQATTENAVSNIAKREPFLDSIHPQVQIEVDPQGNIKLIYPEDTDISTITTGNIIVRDAKGVELKVDFTQSEDDGLTFLGKVPDGQLGNVSVEVPESSYSDLVENPGLPAILTTNVDTDRPQVKVTILPNGKIVLLYPNDTNYDTVDTTDIQVLDESTGEPIEGLVFTRQPDNTFSSEIPENVDTQVKVIVPENSYQDNAGNQGLEGSDTDDVDTQKPHVTVDIVGKSDNVVQAIFEFDEDINESTFNVADIEVEGGILIPDTFKKLEDGRWAIDIKSEKGKTVEAKVKPDSYTDLVGNEGDGHSDTYITIQINSVVPSKNEKDKDVTTIKGKTEPFQEVEVTIPGGKTLTTKSDKDGEWFVETEEPLIDGNTVIAVTKNQDDINVEDKVKLPFVVIEVIAEDDVINIDEQSEFKEQQTLKIKGTLSNPDYPNVRLIVNVNGKEYIEGTNPELVVSKNGTWVLNLPYADALFTRENMDVKASAIDSDNQVISNKAQRVPTIDVIAPQPEITIDKNGLITVEYSDDVDPNTIGKNNITVKTEDGKDLPLQFVPSNDGLTYTAKVPENIDQKINVYVGDDYQDYAGNDGLPSQKLDNDVDTLPPQVEVNIDDTTGKISFKYDEDVVNVESAKDAIVITVNGQPIEITQWEIVGNEVFAQLPDTIEKGQVIDARVPTNSYEDDAGNKGLFGSDQSFLVDTTPPKAQITISSTGQVVIKFPATENVDEDSINPKDDFKITSNGQVLTDSEGNPIEHLYQKTIDPEDGSIIYTTQLPPNLPSTTIDVKVTDYIGENGRDGITVTENAIVDTVPPKVNVSVDEEGNITIHYDPDVDPTSIELDKILINITDPATNTVITVPVELKQNELVVTGKVNLPNGSNVTVKVPEGSYQDIAGNKGLDGQSTASIDKELPKVTVEYVGEVSAGIEFKVSFSEEIFTSSGKEMTNEILKNIISKYGVNISSVVEVDKSPEGLWDYRAESYKVIVLPIDPNQDVTVLVPQDTYQDKLGNLGGNSDSDNANISFVKNDLITLVESGVSANNLTVAGKYENGVNLFGNNPKKLQNNAESNNYKLIISEPESQYGKITINENGDVQFVLDNTQPAIQALKQGEVITEVYTYQVKNIYGAVAEETLTVRIVGTNDAPFISQADIGRVVTTGKTSFSNGTLTDPTVENSPAQAKHTFKFNLSSQADIDSAQVAVNLITLDNSFKIAINGQMIHLKEVFQIEEGDKTTPTQVPLKFEDGTWLATGAPWNANLNGLPRFQIILTETGIRFFGTKTTSSTYLEEIFYDSIEADGLRLPKFISGENTIDIINVDGTGVDAMEGNLSITAGGKFTIADIDSENLSKVVITLNNPLKGDTFVPVLPKGISYSLAEKDGQLILTLTGNASKTDYETSLNSLMFRGTDASYKNNTALAKDISVDIYDDFGAFHSIEGKLNYVGGGEVVKLTQFDFSEADIVLNVLKNAEQSNTGGNSLMTDDHFILGDSHKIDISDLLIGANEQNLAGFVKLDFDSKDHKVTLSVDRDGDPLNERYKMEKILVLSNQSKEISLQELLDHQQLVF